MSNKQSSIEWLYNNLKSHFEHDGDLLEVVKMSFEQAKEMHEEEVINAWGNGWVNGDINENRYEYMAQEYYNEIFKSK